MFYLQEKNLGDRFAFIIKSGWGEELKGLLYFPYLRSPNIKKEVFKNISFLLSEDFKDGHFSMSDLIRKLKLTYGYNTLADNTLDLSDSYDLGHTYKYIKNELMADHKKLISNKMSVLGLNNSLNYISDIFVKKNIDANHKKMLEQAYQTHKKNISFYDFQKEVLMISFENEIRKSYMNIYEWNSV